MTDIRLKLAPPWITFINEVQQLFDGDPQIACNIDETAPSIVLACNNGDKVTALQKILPSEVKFGNITLTVAIDGTPSDRIFISKKELFETAFYKNPAFAYAITPAKDGAWFDMVYVVFRNYVVQFFNDNLNDCHGIVSTLYEDIARDVLRGNVLNGVYFNTDVKYGYYLSKPPREWP